ncbi:MAG: HAMP domain-containing sensor histidine kinase [Candidatus Pacebacteria bacterium]|nr:HAMP domain-containing sensor histidine kinase [Candidatus Paceibacterota bacterium]
MLVTREGRIAFFNDECYSIFGNAEDPQRNMTQDDFASVREVDGELSLSQFMADPDRTYSSTAPRRFVYRKAPDLVYYFSAKHSTITFNSQTMSAVILQDQTMFEDLKRLDEKYQKIYLASVVHDIRTPLNGILGMFDAMEEYGEGLPQEVRNFVSAARKSAKLLLFFTNDIIDYSQIEAKTFSVVKEPFAPTEVLEECVQLLNFNFQRKGLELLFTVEPGVPPTVVSDRKRYMQIMLNLLGNALKFTMRGSVKVRTWHDPRDGKLFSSVSDTGIGIKEEDIPKLFKLFGKIMDSDQLNPTGVGLGLTICKKLTEELGGEISVTSVYGNGSTFTFSISCKEESSMTTSIECLEERCGRELNSSSNNDSRNFLLIVHSNPLAKVSSGRSAGVEREEPPVFAVNVTFGSELRKSMSQIRGQGCSS